MAGSPFTRFHGF